MESFVLLLLVPTLHVAHAAVSQVSIQPTVELVSGRSRVFSGESLRLRCKILDGYNSTWHVQWFWDSQLLQQNGHTLYLRKVSVKASGKYSCQGMKDTAMGNMYTEMSPSLEVHVNGGWAILHSPLTRIVVGATVELTCYLRDNPKVRNVILYKNGVEVMRNGQLNQVFDLTNVTLEDSGSYSCRASWDIRRQTHSVISAPTYVEILMVLTEPVLEMVRDDPTIPQNQMKLICHVQYNVPDPAPPVLYYFYEQDNQVKPASSHNHILVKRMPGLYSCKVRVPQLDLLRLSEGRRFG